MIQDYMSKKMKNDTFAPKNTIMIVSNGGWDTYSYCGDSTVTDSSEEVVSDESRKKTLEYMVAALETELVHEKLLRRLSQMEELILRGHFVERDREDRLLA